MPENPQFVVVTGMSGAGKTQTLRCFEDLGYYCVDNLPAALIPTFAELILHSESPRNRIAVCVDARAGADLLKVPHSLERLTEMGLKPDVLFLDSSDPVLHRRYSETRRRHPSSPTGGIDEGIRRERELLGPLRDRADLVLDTSHISAQELRERIASTFIGEPGRQNLTVTVMSFGFKYGRPSEADMVLDSRFLPNPYYDPGLRPRGGEDTEVRDYVMGSRDAQEFVQHAKSFLKFLIPEYAGAHKSYFTIAVGCTGGQHRSVAIALELHRLLRDLDYDVRLRHRDLNRG
jgi:UPF0042 nucleotide-binding protein